MNLEHMFLSTMIKESSEDAAFEEALSIVPLEELEKLAGEGVDKIVGHIMQGAKTVPLKTIGTIAGGAYGALSDPGVDPQTGEQKGRLGNMAAGALGGLGVGAGLRAAGNYARGLHGPTGEYLRNAQHNVAKATANYHDRRQSIKSIYKGDKHARDISRAERASRGANPVTVTPEPEQLALPGTEEKKPSLIDHIKSLIPSKKKEGSANFYKYSAAEANALKGLSDYVKGGLRSGADYLHEAGPSGVALGVAGLNAARRFVFPTVDPQTGQERNRLGEAARGAVSGGIAGAALGHGIKHFQPAIHGGDWGENAKSVADSIKKKFQD